MQVFCNGEVIIPSKVIQVCITYYFFELCLWCLRNLGGHDQSADDADPFRLGFIGKHFCCYVAPVFLMLAHIADLRARGRISTPVGVGVLVKAPKPHQDRRFDLPTIGPRTVDEVARAGLRGIAVVAGSAIIAEPAAVAAAADKAKVFVIGIKGAAPP